MLSFVEVPNGGPGADWEPDAQVMHAAMHKPGVTAVHLRHLLNLSRPMPRELRQQNYTSPVTTLRVSHCGPVYANFAHALSWPAKLKTLQLLSYWNYGGTWQLKNYKTSARQSRMSGFLEAIAPQKDHLEHLCYETAGDNGTAGHIRDTWERYRDLVNLKTLHLNIDFLWIDDEDRLGGWWFHSTDVMQLDLEEMLPASLQELVIEALDLQMEFLAEAEEAREVKAFVRFLQKFASRKEADSAIMPNLRTLHIYNGIEVSEPQISDIICSLQQTLQRCQVNFTWYDWRRSSESDVIDDTICGEFHVGDRALLDGGPDVADPETWDAT